MSVVKADVTNQSSFHYENKCVFPNKVIRDNNKIFHDSYVLMEDILQMPKKILGKQKNTQRVRHAGWRAGLLLEIQGVFVHLLSGRIWETGSGLRSKL